MTYWLLVSMLCLDWTDDWCSVRQPVVSIWATEAECVQAADLAVQDLYSFCVYAEEVKFW